MDRDVRNIEPKDIIREALEKDQPALSEHDAKQFLSLFGIPVCREIITFSVDQAVAEAAKIGFPVALKVSGTGLFHKTEVGGVALNLKNDSDVRKEGQRLIQIPGCEGLLVQEMVPGDRELVCGLTRDPLFGPSVMFGIGGILTEIIQDVSFRMAPLNFEDAQAMIQEIQSKKILKQFREQSPVKIEMLCHILMAVGEIGARFKNVLEIDINPLKIQRDGNAVAVDALVLLKGREETVNYATIAENENYLFSVSVKKKSIIPFFEPSSVAIIGASSTPGKPGHTVIKNIKENDYSGKLYLVNPKGGKILGMPVYSSIDSLPGEIDLAIIILPAKGTPKALRECVEKGIGHVVLSAGGFAEVDEYGGQIQQELIDIIKKEKVRVLGPNTSGHISTPHRFTSTFFPLGKIQPGKVAYIAQTGNFATHSMKYILSSEHFGVSRVIGLGNKIDIDESEALEYLSEDSKTIAIIMYLESIKNPRRFLEIARKTTYKKPVVMLKGGVTEAGKKAAVAHTAAMAAEERLVKGMLQQAGIISIKKYSHLINVGKALSMMPLPQGNRVGIIAPSGAMLVVLTDLSIRLGLEVPDLEPNNTIKLQKLSPPFIRMRNPVDIWAAASNKGVEYAYKEGLKIILADKNIDAAVVVLLLTEDTGIPSYDFIFKEKEKNVKKPIFFTFTGDRKLIDRSKEYLESRNIPTFLEIEEPFEILSIMLRCQKAMISPDNS